MKSPLNLRDKLSRPSSLKLAVSPSLRGFVTLSVTTPISQCPLKECEHWTHCQGSCPLLDQDTARYPAPPWHPKACNPLCASQEAFSLFLVLMKKLPRAAPESPAWLLEDGSGVNGAEAGLAALGVGTQLKLRQQQQQWAHRMVQVRRHHWGSCSPTSLLKQGLLEHVTQDVSRWLLNLSRERASITSLGCDAWCRTMRIYESLPQSHFCLYHTDIHLI